MSYKASYTIRGLEELLKNFGDAREIIRGIVKDTMQVVVTYLASDVRSETPVDQGRLRSSITPRIDEDEKRVQGIVGTNVDYALYVEYSTKPHWPPPSALTVWARRHNIPLILVLRSIARKGTKGKEMFKKALEKNAGHIFDDFENALEAIVNRLAK